MTLQLMTGCSVNKDLTSVMEEGKNVMAPIKDDFFHIKCILHCECLQTRQMINQCFYRDVLECLR
jgi:hypothetical protein